MFEAVGSEKLVEPLPPASWSLTYLCGDFEELAVVGTCKTSVRSFAKFGSRTYPPANL